MPWGPCTHLNPVNNGILTQTLSKGELKKLQPEKSVPSQGDHVFGDVVAAIQTGLKDIFGSIDFRARMNSYNPRLEVIWNALKNTDFGHGHDRETHPVVLRANVQEVDQHGRVFGIYSERLQWQLCEIVCTNKIVDGSTKEERRIFSAKGLWKARVLQSFDDLMKNLVDRTALEFYINNPGQTRTVEKNSRVSHPPMSFNNATEYVVNGDTAAHKRVREVLKNYDHLRGSLVALLNEFNGPTKSYSQRIENGNIRHIWTPVAR